MSSRPAWVPRVVCGAVLLGAAVSGCGGGGGVSLPSERPGSGLPTLSTPAATTAAESTAGRPTPPAVTLPTRSAAPAPPVTTTAPPTTRPTTTAPPRTAAPPTTAAPRTTTAPATATAPPTTAAPSSTAPASTPAAVPVASSSSPPAWVWWLLGLLIALVVAALVWVAVRGRRARKAWEARLAEVVTESTWLAHEFLPYALGAGPAVNRRDVWTAFRPRVHALVNNLTAVAASASTDRMPTVDRLRAAVTDVSSAMDRYAAAGPDDRESLGAVRQAQRQLEEALRVLQPPPVNGP